MKTREQVSLALIEDNPWQPRREIDQDELQKLADSIYQLGLLQAPLGRRHPEVSGRIQLAFGHRRVAALRLLLQQGRGEMYVEMDVAGISDEGMAVLALTENERRKQLSQIEVVRAHYKAIDETNLTIQTLADQLDIDRSTLSNHLRVLDLPDFVLQHVESGKLRVSVAREFLVFQTATHQHTEDMQEVIRRIVNVETYGGGVPDWRRRHVRKMVSEAVSYNEKDWRPLGPPTAHSTGGGNRVASFDRDDFVWEFRDSLHTIPADDGHVENYQRSERYDKSRQWTCEVKEWSRRQSRATREANQEVEARGGSAPAASSKSASRDKHFEVVLAKDPVFKQVATSRAKKGPSRPVNDEERAQLGTRAEMRDVSGNTGFWKILEKGELDGRQNKYAWSREGGGIVPPWFPDLDECQRCTIGAAYAKSRDGYTLRDVTLCCFNREHYQEKLQAGEAAYREKTQAHQKGVDRQDSQAVKHLIKQLEPLTDDTCQVLAASLVAANPALAWANPLGFYDEDWSHESGLGELVRDLLGSESLVAKHNRREEYGSVINPDFIASMAPEDLRKLAAALMTHHLRLAGKIDTVSRGNANLTEVP